MIVFVLYIQAVSRKGFGSSDCDTIYTIYLSLCTQTADPNLFRGTAGTNITINKKELEQNLRNLKVESPLWISQQNGLFIKLKGSFTSETSEVLNHNFKIIVSKLLKILNSEYYIELNKTLFI